ncbi:hypothetical protein BMF94_6271 [Rhodotorula taiwanensis]|uniref:RNA methyltransferase n=1 Tax=Rhodotorula taiwanensis TaxID=741276 RepID=A0A2S5B251_9BASI|nr:hypothetical protein BMF94_6271 [Rhodotorula taiwanensis]
MAAPESPPTAPAETVTATQRNRQNHRETWPYGNYRSYYSFRPASTGTDADAEQLDHRLALLDPALFNGKRLLDIGTNAGKVAIDAVRHLAAERAVGVDIDPLLIQDAVDNARLAELNLDTRGASDLDTRTDATPALQRDDESAPTVAFFEANVMEDGWFDHASRDPRLFGTDVVTLFSITKWLHLHNGDAGMRRLFANLYAFLPAAGVLVVEPQEYANYRRAVKKNKDLRETFKALEMRPPFDAELREVGFVLEQQIDREEGGFSRPLLVWRKPTTRV